MFKIMLCTGLLLCTVLAGVVFAEGESDDNTGRDDTQVYHLFDDASLTSTLKIQYDKPRIVIKSVYPQLDWYSEPNTAISFNQLVMNIIQEEIDEFKNRVLQNQATQHKLSKSSIHNDLFIDYDTSAIQSGKHNIVSLRFSIQGHITGLAYPYHYHRVLNYDLHENQQIQLSDLFDSDSTYTNVLEDYILENLTRHGADRRPIITGSLPKEEMYKNWNIKANGLLITFDANQPGPLAYGPQTILIPYSVIQDVLADDAPIASCVAHNKRCAQNNILTGGFIDQAINAGHGQLNPVLGEL